MMNAACVRFCRIDKYMKNTQTKTLSPTESEKSATSGRTVWKLVLLSTVVCLGLIFAVFAFLETSSDDGDDLKVREDVAYDYKNFVTSLSSNVSTYLAVPKDARPTPISAGYVPTFSYIAVLELDDKNKIAEDFSKLTLKDYTESKLMKEINPEDIDVSKDGKSATLDISDELKNDPLLDSMSGSKKSGKIYFLRGGSFWVLDAKNFGLKSTPPLNPPKQSPGVSVEPPEGAPIPTMQSDEHSHESHEH